MTLRVAMAASIALVAASLVSCGSDARDGPEPRPIAVTLDGHAGPENVGVVVAESLGLFAHAGIKIWWLGDPVQPKLVPVYVTGKDDDFGLVDLPELIVARDRDMNLTAVGSLLPQPTAAMIWLPGSGIRNVADLAGKTIALSNASFQEGLLQAVLARAGLSLDDVKVKRVGYTLVPNLLSKKADAIFAKSSNIPKIELESRGVKPVVKRVQELGIPSYDELVVIGRSDFVAEESEVVQKFMSAVDRGTAMAVANPKRAARILYENEDGNPEASLADIEMQLQSTLPLLSRSGYIDPRRATDIAAWMHREGLIHHPWPAAALLTNKFLPSSSRP